MRIVIAPDKFRGSLSAVAVAAHLAEGLHSVLPEAGIVQIPMADGGEGTVDAAVSRGYQRVPVTVSGPLGDPVAAEIAVLRGSAVVELALASGQDALPVGADGRPRQDALRAGSSGTGDLIVAALDHGCRHIVLGVGGSANTDAGAGLLQALGVRIRDADGAEISGGGGALGEVAEVDLSHLDPRVAETEFVLAADVDNPLTGPTGAAAVFGPQKGASPEQVARLEANLTAFVAVLTTALGPAATLAARLPGAGAAGGVGYAALTVLGATRRPGVDVVLELVQLADQIPGSDLVITGEGSLDEQSLGGKTPVGVAALARRHGVPVVAVCGRTTLDRDRLAEAGFADTVALTDLEPDVATCIAHAGPLLVQVGRRLGDQLARP